MLHVPNSLQTELIHFTVLYVFLVFYVGHVLGLCPPSPPHPISIYIIIPEISDNTCVLTTTYDQHVSRSGIKGTVSNNQQSTGGHHHSLVILNIDHGNDDE